MKFWHIFVNFAKKIICCDLSSEPSRRDEGSHHIVSIRKNILQLSSNTPSYLELCISLIYLRSHGEYLSIARVYYSRSGMHRRSLVYFIS